MSKLDETFDAESIAYVESIIQDLRDNPDIAEGMHVEMFHITMDGDKIFRGHAVITRVFWDDFYCQNMCDLKLFSDAPHYDNAVPVYGVMRCQVEPVSFSGKEQRQWLKSRIVA